MKQAAIALLLLLNLLAGCTPAVSPTLATPTASADDTTTDLPEAHPPADAIDFGEVTMLLNSRKSELDESDLQRQQRILAAVSAALQRQTGVRMTLRAVPAMNPAEELRTMAAAGKPPQISIYVPKGYGDLTDELDKQASTTLVPLPLDDALTTYGGHLRRLILEDIWEQSTVNGRIMSIPLQRAQFTSGLVLNRTVMEQYGWQVPTTVEEFEELLDKAKTAEIMPLLASPFTYTSRSWFGADGTLTKQDDKWIPIYASQARLDWLQQQKKWIEKGWMQGDLNISAQEEWMNSGRWLCQEMMLDTLGDTQDIIVRVPLKLCKPSLPDKIKAMEVFSNGKERKEFVPAVAGGTGNQGLGWCTHAGEGTDLGFHPGGHGCGTGGKTRVQQVRLQEQADGQQPQRKLQKDGDKQPGRD